MKSKIKTAPIVLFAYNRPDHLKQTVESLKKNVYASDSDLIVFSDAEKTSVDLVKVKKTRQYIKTINGFKSVRVVERKENFGLSKNIIEGVSEVVNKYGRVIVLEDDMITSKFFYHKSDANLHFEYLHH